MAEPGGPSGSERPGRPEGPGGLSGFDGVDGLLAGKRLLITGVITKDSIAFHVAQAAQAQGAEVLLTSFGRVRSMTERAAQRLETPVDVLELDVNRPEDLDALAAELQRRWGRGGWRPARDRVRARGRARRALPDRTGGERRGGLPDQRLLTEGGRGHAGAADAGGLHGRRPGLRRQPRLADLRLDGRRQGGARVGLALPRARPRRSGHPREPGQRRPLGTVAARGIPGFEGLASLWQQQAPLGWDIGDPGVVAGPVCFLLSDLARGISGEILHVDGGFNAIGAPPV